MPRCIVKSKSELGNGVNFYSVIFEADDGYQEHQQYKCTEAELKTALSHFNDSHIETKASSLELTLTEEPEVVLTVKSSVNAVESMKKINAV